MSSIGLIFMSGLAIGILGNMHCIAMCGPLALMLPTQKLVGFKKLLAIFSYNMGRASSYTILGFVFGLIGNSLSLIGLQQALSIAAGLILLLINFTNVFKNKQVRIFGFKQFIQNKIVNQLQLLSSIKSFYFFGLLNGLLPCGLVYIAIATAIALANVYNAMWLMFAFGVGTFPLMLSLLIFKSNISIAVQQKAKKILPVFVSIMAIVLIVRGLGLNIPNLSPAIYNVKQNAISCH